jgi:membrane associated rhomboid family serine protease
MKLLPYFLFAAFLSAVYVLVFILPNHIQGYALIPEKISQGEFWRFLTYPFDHIDMSHLIKNLMGLMIITAGIISLKTRFSDFSSIYLIAGFLAVLPLWFILQFTALGASVAIYSVFGIIALESKKYEMKEWHILALVSAGIIIEAVFSGQNTAVLSSLSHFSGVLFGVFAFFFIKQVHSALDSKKIKCLRKI